jgi:hypothetical protein
MARLLKRHGAVPVDEREEMDSLAAPASPTPATPADRPNQLPIAHPLRPAEPQPATSSPTRGAEDGDMTATQDGIGKLVAALHDISPG